LHIVGAVFGLNRFDHSYIGLPTNRPVNIGHRGSSGTHPEHTAESYKQAIEDGADMIECDMVITKDLKVICRHEYDLSGTTNIAELPQFADKKREFSVDGVMKTDWFSFDFTLDELKSVKAVQRYDFRDKSMDGLFSIITLEEYVHIARDAGRPVGIFPEIKKPELVNAIPGLFPNGSRFEDIVIRELARLGYTKPEDGCLIQCFNDESLVYLKNVIKTEIPLVACTDDIVDDNKLTEWHQKDFYGVCFWKDIMYSNYKDGGYKNYVMKTSNFAERCHDMGFTIFLYTFRNEDRYLGWDYKQDIHNEYDRFLWHNIEGYFVDFPATFKRHLDTVYDDCMMVAASNLVKPSMGLILLMVLLFSVKLLS
jgi:glycerophosphoryl diester phosphodiesterase